MAGNRTVGAGGLPVAGALRRRLALAGTTFALLVGCGGGDSQPGPVEAAADAPPRAHALALTPQQAARATWTAPVALPLVPVSGAVLNTGKVLLWAADAPNNETYGGSGQAHTALFDPANNSASSRSFNIGHDMFCPGTARLPDGRVIVNGGVNANATSLYDPAADSWTRVADMKSNRGYNANTPLADGSVLTLGGSWNGGQGPKPAEVFTPAGGWRALGGVTTANTAFLTADPSGYYRSDNHMWLIPAGNGRVLHAGPSRQMNWIDTRGDGSTTPAGLRADDTDSVNGNAVMFDAGKVLTVGGGVRYDDADGKRAAYVIDLSGGGAVTRPVAPMAYPRTFANSVVLPNGQVVVIGGQTHGVGFSDANAVLPAELWDPQTETFTVLPPMAVARNYHSIGLLLPDGRVLSAGGGLCNCAGDHADLQILSPPYLFNADGSAAARPVITAAPAQLAYGGTASVSTSGPVAAFSLVRLGAATHTVNNDQRRIALAFTGGAGNNYQLALPTNPGILLPGQWMLFALNANGTPSVAKMVSVSNAGVPLLQNPGDVTVATGAAVNVTVAGSAPGGGTLTFSAAGLPAGLAFNAATGAITGSVQTAGRYVVTVRASNGTQTVSTDVLLKIDNPSTGSGLLAQYFGNAGLAGTPLLQRVEAPNIGLGASCAGQGGRCNFGGTQIVSYGAGDRFASRVATGGIDCSDTIFGDPAPGTAKACYVGVTGVPQPAAAAAPFSVRWTGWVEAAASGPTLFRLASGTGARLWVDRRLVFDSWKAAAPPVAVNLVAGQRYAVMVEYTLAAGTLQLQWQPPGDSLAAVPASRLFASTPAAGNLARGRPATQSSLASGGDAARAVDGNTDGNFGANSVTHTANTAPQDWWQVDLGQRNRIDVVQLWNRTDCCSERLGDFTLFVADNDMTGRSLEQLKADPAVTARAVAATPVAPSIGIPVGAWGRYVRVQLNGADTLSLAEVQVWGDGASYQTPTLAAIADQQTQLGSGVALAVRGSDPNGNALTYSAGGLPPGLSIDPQSGVIGGTAGSASSGAVAVSATNAGGLSATVRFNWTVLGAAQQVVSLPAPLVASGVAVAYNPVLGAGSASQFSWNFGDGSGDTAFAAGAAAGHVYAAPGVYTVTLTSRTADGRSTAYRFLQAVRPAGPTAPARASSQLLLEPRTGASTRLWVVNPDNDSVSVFDTATNARIAEVPVGSAPRSLALAGDGRVWVVNRDGASISIVAPATLTVAQTVSLPRASQPFGIVFGPADGSAYVTLEATGRLLKLSGSSGAALATLAVGDNPRHLAMNAAGTQLLVSRFITRPLPGEGTVNVRTVDAAGAAAGAEVLAVNPASLTLQRTTVLGHIERTDAENQGRGFPNYLGAAAISPDGKTAWVPSKQDNLRRGSARDGQALNFQSTVRAVSSRIDLASGNEDLAGRVDHDNAGVASAAVYHPSGAYLFVALETSRQVAVVDAVGRRELFRFEVGLAPQSVAVSADGLKLYVGNFMGRSVSAVDLQPLVGFGQPGAAPTATLPTIAVERLAASVLLGKQLFYDARDPRLARDSYLSCAACHNDGGHDGRTWDLTSQGEGLRNTTALKGRAGSGQGLVHWSANFDEVQDFEGQIRTLAAGSGLMTDADYNAGTRSKPLGDRKAGVSAELDALAAYVGSLATFAPSPWRNADGSLGSAAQAGRTVFAASCASCHGGAGFTNSADVPVLANIGTLKASSGKRLNGALTGIDTPTLRDAWATAPYLHDGSAPTLAAAIGAHNNVALTAADLANVVAYVQQIGAEEPALATNLAAGKPTTQSSTALGGDAGRAVDGNTSGNWSDNSVTHTDGTVQPWWQVDLGQPSAVQSVQLFNRTDCCADRLANAWVFVSAGDMSGRTLAQLQADASVARVPLASMGNAASVTLALAAQGRYVRVQLAGSNNLSLAEVRVLGLPLNLAAGRPAAQSSTAFDGEPGRAVDGRTSGTYGDNSVTHTDFTAQPWWQVDLGQARAVQTVQLWNRTDWNGVDCCSNRLSNFHVLVSPTDMTGRTLAQLLADPTVRQVRVASLNGAASLSVPFAGASARYVRVQLAGSDALSLAEVQVFGR